MVSIILPTRNEPLINELIVEIHGALEKEQLDIVVIDLSDSPPDIKGARIYRQQTKGLGNAVLEGVGRARDDEIVVMDADFSHDPKDIPALLAKLREGNDFVMGSRYCEGGKTEDEGYRYGIFPNSFSSKIYCRLASTLLGISIKDPMNGFAVTKKRVYQELQLNPRGYKIHTETIYKAKKKGFRIAEVPTTFHKRRAGESSTGFGEAFRTLRFIMELWLGLR